MPPNQESSLHFVPRHCVMLQIFCFLLFTTFAYPQKETKTESARVKEAHKKALRFIVFGDWGRNGEDNQRETAQGMGIVAKSFKPEFIASMGDNFYPSGVRSTRDHAWLASFEDIYTAHSLQTDWYIVLGNHDYKGSPQAEIDYTDIDRRWNMPARYYSKIIFIGNDSTQGVLLVFLDTTPFLSEYYETPEHKVKGQDTSAQRIWLEKTLAGAPSYVKWKFVFGHHPLWTGGGRMKAPETMEMKNLFRPIFEKYHVNVYFCGHEHSLQYIKPEGFTHYFISGAGSETTPAIVHPDGGQFANSVNGFMDVTVKDDQMEVNVINYLGENIYSTIIPHP
jgi:tartrate-resistant acid phosphatase type 5